MKPFAFHPELFDHRQRALDALADKLALGGVLVCESHDLAGLRLPNCVEEREVGTDVVIHRPRPGRTAPTTDEARRAIVTPTRPSQTPGTASDRPAGLAKAGTSADSEEAECHFLEALAADLRGRSCEAVRSRRSSPKSNASWPTAAPRSC